MWRMDLSCSQFWQIVPSPFWKWNIWFFKPLNILTVVKTTQNIVETLDAYPLWHHRRWTKQKISSLFSNSKNENIRSTTHMSSKYWMPIHYDTIKDGKTKQTHKKSYSLIERFGSLTKYLIFDIQLEDLIILFVR